MKITSHDGQRSYSLPPVETMTACHLPEEIEFTHRDDGDASTSDNPFSDPEESEDEYNSESEIQRRKNNILGSAALEVVDPVPAETNQDAPRDEDGEPLSGLFSEQGARCSR